MNVELNIPQSIAYAPSIAGVIGYLASLFFFLFFFFGGGGGGGHPHN